MHDRFEFKPKFLIANALLAVLYFTAATIGLSLDAVGGFAALVWPPTGLAIAATAVFGRALWPGIFLGAFSVNFYHDAPLLAAAGIGIGNTLEAVLAVYLWRRFTGFSQTFKRLAEVVGFIVWVAVVSTAVSASIGVASLMAFGKLASADAVRAWIAWWMGDFMGAIVIVPMILVFRFEIKRRRTVRDALEWAFLGCSLVLLTLLVCGKIPTSFEPRAAVYILFPALIWASLRFEVAGAVFSNTVVFLSVLGCTLGGQGPFIEQSLTESLLFMQIFLGVLFVSSLILAGAKAELEIASRAKSTFIAAMSHEIRTPLGAILGFAELMKNQGNGQSPEDRERFLNILIRNALELSRLVDDLLDISKIEAGRLKVEPMPIDIGGLLDEVCQSLDVKAKKKNVRLVLRKSSDLPGTVRTDPVRLRQILMNIVGNAVKFTPSGEVAVDASYAAERLTILVRDTGPGIAESHRELLFRPFSQVDSSLSRKHGGAGLGLILSRRLARALGGDVTLLESSPGQGSTFSITVTG